MSIKVLYFAILRQRLGKDYDVINFEQQTAGDVAKFVSTQQTSLDKICQRCRIAVNQEFVDSSHPLSDGDEVALIPPVSGGQDSYVALLSEPLSIDRCLSKVKSPQFGGICIFVGVVRNHSQGRDVSQLQYTAYRGMVEKVLRKIASDAEQSHAPCRVAIEHRIGSLTIGDIAVIVCAASPHRAESFAAARQLIEELKKNAPIWKKERSSEGFEWVGMGP